ncbi:hypothetical protein QQX09_06715 [Demequina sp. SYSU T00192]|uniref:Uncharacterized protein n=1 Tax=Demequina litoralis TaxID=3051660 RepID=A0ABT8G902_9MICO|nr:hypothetical protein [Demequina sp. SYSU T00192]MDN4475542.1 hypothetical protein [Demequina sp. SYSU T00192]
MTAPETLLLSTWPWIASSLVGAAVLIQWWWYGTDLPAWDWLLVTGAILFAVLFPVSAALPERAATCVKRLAAGGALQDQRGAAPEAEAIVERLNGSARGWARAGATVAATLMTVAWIWSGRITPVNVGLFVLELLGATLAGLFLGRAIGYGRLGRSLAAQGVTIKARPGHPDGAAGLRPVGELFLFSASIFAAIAIYLGIWPLTDLFEQRYEAWRGPYAVLLVTVVAFSFLTFLLPFGWFHERMREQRRDAVARADHAASEALAMRDASRAAGDDETRRLLDERFEDVARQFHEAQAMPTWPFDTRIRKRFTMNQVLAVLPLALKALSLDDTWTTFWTRLGDALLGDGS